MKDSKRIETLRKMLYYLRPYRANLLFSILLALLSVILSLYLPILIGRAVDWIGRIGEAGGIPGLISLLAVMAGVVGAAAFVQWIGNLVNQRIVYRMARDIRKQAFDKIERLPLSYLDTHSHGDILSRVISDVDQFTDGLLIGFTQFFAGIMTILGTLLFMLSVNVWITLVVVILTPMSLFVANFISRKTFRMFRLQSETRGEQTAFVNEMIGNRQVVKAFGREGAVQAQFDEINERLGKYSLRAIFYSSLTNPCTRFVNNLVYAGVGLVGALYALTGGLTVGQLTVFLAYANQYTKPFNEISEVVAELQNALACAARVFELIEAETEGADQEDSVFGGAVRESDEAVETSDDESVGAAVAIGEAMEIRKGKEVGVADGIGVVVDKERQADKRKRTDVVSNIIAMADEMPGDKGTTARERVGNVELKQVCFSYRPEQKLIEDLNLRVRSGQRVAIVGPTGCGKTTVINLLMRFYEINGGQILVEGKDIRRLSRRLLRQSYGMVLQETWLRSGTVHHNIAQGKPDATREEVVAAAKASHAHSFIKRLPEGYDTVIGEEGGSLSQGQKQLLCIARVMLCLPPMLILDEATSSIDTRTEIRIGKAFARMMEGRTSFIVAHRLSTVRSADVILVMKDGRIIEQGSHEELLAAAGFYRELYMSQFAGI